jgi:hypothetical protein
MLNRTVELHGSLFVTYKVVCFMQMSFSCTVGRYLMIQKTGVGYFFISYTGIPEGTLAEAHLSISVKGKKKKTKQGVKS